jgi:hypothetical protein
MSEGLRQCPVCNKGRMKRLPQVGELSREDNTGGRLTEYVCDNEECKHIETSE